jgi:hypothetical protein
VRDAHDHEHVGRSLASSAGNAMVASFVPDDVNVNATVENGDGGVDAGGHGGLGSAVERALVPPPLSISPKPPSPVPPSPFSRISFTFP